MQSQVGRRIICTEYCAAHMNRVLVDMWQKVQLVCAPTIVKSFKLCNLLPLQPPTDKKFVEQVRVSTLQCGTGKKASEMAVKRDDMYLLNDVHTSQPTNDSKTIISSQNNPRNLVLRHVAYSIINKTVVKPSQEIMDIQQEISQARTVKLDMSRLSESSRMNPDTSRGLFVVAETRARARLVMNNRVKEKKIKEEKKILTALKNAKLDENQKSAGHVFQHFETLCPTMVDGAGV